MIRFFSLLLLHIMLLSCKSTPFTFTGNDEGIQLYESGNPVFFYQKKPKSLNGDYICNNYLHPVYGLNGDTLTEEFPADHLFHRGVFWGWHQIFAGERNLGDGWINQGISYDVNSAETSSDSESAALKVSVTWKSDSLGNDGSFMQENTTVTVHKQTENSRIIDFEIVLNPLIDSLQIGGSDDEKGYGGFCFRMKMPDDLTFTSRTGKVEAQNLQVTSGNWMEFSADFDRNGKKSSITIVSHSSNAGPGTWIIRHKGSMQNAVFPGRERVSIDNPLTLRYRVIIHEGVILPPDGTW